MKGLEVRFEQDHISFDKLCEFFNVHRLVALIDFEIEEDMTGELFGQAVHIAVGNFIGEFLCFEHKLGARIPIILHHLLVGLIEGSHINR